MQEPSRGRFEAVIFDLFGTLVDSFSATVYGQVKAAMAESLSLPAGDFDRLWLASYDQRMRGASATLEDDLRHIASALGVEATPAGIAQAARIRREFTRDALKPRSDAIATLTSLRAGGRKLGLISDCSTEIPELWPETPFAGLFDATVFSCAVGFRKPEPRIYHLACEILGVAPADCLYVGDGGSEELTGALRVGMTPVLIDVSIEDTYVVDRGDAERWTGQRISSLAQVLSLVSPGGGRRDADF